MTKLPIPIEVLTEAATTRGSTLYAWMITNHDTFEAIVKQAVRPNWERLGQRFGEYGLRDGSDGVPSGETTRQTWWKVRKAVAARRAAAAKRAVADKPGPVAPQRSVTPAKVARPAPGRTGPAATDLDALFGESGLSLPKVVR
jgi:hypothetical protein